MLKTRDSSAKIVWGGVKMKPTKEELKRAIEKPQMGPFQKYKKPPIGLRPRIIWLNERAMEITEAIERYQEVGKEVPERWNIELAWVMAQMGLEGNKIQ